MPTSVLASVSSPMLSCDSIVLVTGAVFVSGAGVSVVVSVVAVCAKDATGRVIANAAQRGRMFKYLFMLGPNQLNLIAFTMS